MYPNLIESCAGVLWDISELSWMKVALAGTIWVVAIWCHTQRHFLEEDERKEGTCLSELADIFPYLICFGGLMIVGVGYGFGERPLHGPILPHEAISLTIGASGALLRIWAIETLKNFFTYKVGIRKGHR